MKGKKRTQQLLIRVRAWKGDKRRYFKNQIKSEIILDIIIKNIYSMLTLAIAHPSLHVLRDPFVVILVHVTLESMFHMEKEGGF
jgi:hypothetical protein